MSEKKWCPGCDFHSSGLYEAWANGWDCPYCGLDHSAWSEVITVRAARDDDELSQRLSELRIENDKLKRELKAMHDERQATKDKLRNFLGDG